MTFLRELLAVIIGVFISFAIMFVIFLGIASIIGSEQKINVKNNSILTLKLDKQIKDYAPKDEDPFVQILGLEEEKIGMNEILNAIENAKYDDKIKGISLELSNLNAGISQLQSIRNKVLEFKETGKFVTSFADSYSNKSYYLSSVADSIYLNPVGSIDFKGLSSEILFFKHFQEKYGIKMEVIRHGKYKSAVEPFLSNEMSVANREQTQSFLNSIWNQMLEDIGYSRNKTNEELNLIADDLLARNATLAKEHNMITAGLYKDQYNTRLENLIGVSGKDAYKISLTDYVKSGKGRLKSTAKDRIAVIYAQGEIIYGKGDENYIGQDLMVKAIRNAKENKSVKAVVLRVNSPGGSGLASDIIWRELELLKQEKPLVVSMGNYAASGGYYLACNANRIFAESTTITGSIGVFGAVPNVHGLAERNGINAEQVGTNKQSTGYSAFEPISEYFYNSTQESIENFYKTFVGKVAEGRNTTFTKIDSIAQGRVWTGIQAQKNGLVDEIGSLEDAINSAAEMADLSSYKVRNYPSYTKEFKDAISINPFAKIDAHEVIKKEMGEETYILYNNLKRISNLKGIQARIPFYIEIN